jgi:hypothetical protein
MFDDPNDLNGFLQNLVFKATEAANDYHKFLFLTKVFYESIQEEDQKENKHIKKILDDYNKDPEEIRKSKMLGIASTDMEGYFEYMTANNRDSNLIYEEDLEKDHHKNQQLILTFFGSIMRKYTKGSDIAP